MPKVRPLDAMPNVGNIIMAQVVEIGWDKQILSRKTDIPIRTLNSKLATGYWTFNELQRIASATRMTDERILKLFGRRQK